MKKSCCGYFKKIKKFFLKDIERLLDKYKPGDPTMKPDVLEQIKEITAKREKMMSEQNDPQIMMHVPGKEPVKLGLQEAANIINTMQQQGQELIRKNSELEGIISQLQKQLVKFQMQGNSGTPIFDSPSMQSNEIDNIRKENIELTNKVLTHINNEKLLKMEIQELKNKISNLELKPASNIKNEPLMKPIEIIKEKSKLEPEVKVVI